MVQGILRLETQLQMNRLSQREITEHGKVRAVVTVPVNDIAAAVPKRPGRRDGKGRRIVGEPRRDVPVRIPDRAQPVEALIAVWVEPARVRREGLAGL